MGELEEKLAAIFRECAAATMDDIDSAVAAAKQRVRRSKNYKDWLEIVEGLTADDRVVTEGGYMVKLAASDTQIGQPHVH